MWAPRAKHPEPRVETYNVTCGVHEALKDLMLDLESYYYYYGHNNFHMGVVMNDISQIMPVTKVKRGLLDILKTMQEEDSTITLTRNGEPVGVMMTPNRYEAILETIEILADKEVLAALRCSAKEFQAGKVYTDTDVWGD
jgi:PHD/YefM family antitoxin component YafN of YafNO toxin-antitoxin module